MTEAELDARILELAEDLYLAAFHFPDSRRATHRGWPDWIILGIHGILFRECKSETGQPTPEQIAVGWSLKAHGLNWAVWRPADWRAGRIQEEMEKIV